MTPPLVRPAFDPAYAAQAKAYLNRHRLTQIDPLADPPESAEPIMTASLTTARLLFAQGFSSARASEQPFRAYPFFVARSGANAFAVEDEGLQLCGIELGMVTAALEMSTFVFSQATLFPEVGEASQERSPDLPAEAHLAFWTADRLSADPDPGTPVGAELVPQNIERQHAAQVLTQYLLRFVWLHELYHGLNGHTGLMASRGDADRVLKEMPDSAATGIVEREPQDRPTLTAPVRHAMEFDADRSAMWRLVRMQQLDHESMDAVVTWPRALRLKLTIFAGALMAFLFDQAARRAAAQSGLTHPLAHHRLVDLARTLASNLVEGAEDVRSAFQAVLAEMTALQHRVPQFVSGQQLVDSLRSDTLQRELDAMDGVLTRARESFAPWAYRAKP